MRIDALDTVDPAANHAHIDIRVDGIDMAIAQVEKKMAVAWMYPPDRLPRAARV